MKQTTSSVHASLFLGLLSGLLTMFAVLMTGLPVLHQVQAIETRLVNSQRETIFLALEAALENQKADLEHQIPRFSLALLHITQNDEIVYSSSANGLSPQDTCPFHGLKSNNNQESWWIECQRRGDYLIQFAWSPQRLPVEWALFYIVLISLFSGIVLAMGVVKILQPLNRIVTSLENMERGVRRTPLAPTGYYEFDVLIEQVNLTTHSIIERENMILGRLQLVQHLARLVAHELRNPLQSLEILTTVLVEEESLAERQKTAKSIQQEIRNLDGVVQRILADGQSINPMQLRKTQQSLQPTIDHLISLLKYKAQLKSIVFEVTALSERPFSFDAPLLNRALENLLINAIQHMHQGGVIQIGVLPHDAQTMAITIRDSGSGVPPEIEKNMFDVNVTTRPNGSGLGLSLVKAVVDAHQGTISYSRCSPGSQFTLLLPNNEAP